MSHYKWNVYTKEFDRVVYGNTRIKMTPEGGVAIRLTNKTGAASVKGTLVKTSTGTDDAVDASDANGVAVTGIIYESGVADGSRVWVVVYGIAEVLLKNTTSATKGYWVKSSDAAGRADATNAAPPGGGIPELDEHMREVGHCLQSVDAGTDKLAKIILHLN
jgi:hypothetical protein